jgi:hypothetical protein
LYGTWEISSMPERWFLDSLQGCVPDGQGRTRIVVGILVDDLRERPGPVTLREQGCIQVQAHSLGFAEAYTMSKAQKETDALGEERQVEGSGCADRLTDVAKIAA